MYKIIKQSLLFLLLPATLFLSNSFAQETAKKSPTTLQSTERHKMHVRDSVIRSFNKSDTSINGLIQRLAHYTSIFNQIHNNLSESLDTTDASLGMPLVTRRINKIDSLINTHKSSTLRYLFVLRDNLDHLQNTLEGWQSGLEDVSKKLIQNQNEILKFAKDTAIKITPGDSVIRKAYLLHRLSVENLFRKTDLVNRIALSKVSLLQDKITLVYNRILDQTDQIDLKIKRFAIKALAGESDYLWNTKLQSADFKPAFNSTVILNGTLFGYFIKNETITHYISMFFFLLVLAWIVFVRSKTIVNRETSSEILGQANYVFKMPVISSLLIACAIVPYFYDHPPVVYLETLFLISMSLVLLLIRKQFHTSSFKFLLCLFFLSIMYGASNLFIQITVIDRYAILFLSVISIILGLVFLRILKATDHHIPYTIVGVRVFVILQILSFCLNVAGRFSLAKMIGITAVFNLWFGIILFLVIQIIVQTLFLQFQVKKDEDNIIGWIDYTVVITKIKKTLFMLATVVWLFFLLQNLSVDDWLIDNVNSLLDQSRSVGGSSFTLGGFVVFIFVIWLSSLLSRVISYFYDISSQRVTDFSVEKKKNRTSALLIRLGVFSAGFLLAVAASGFPLEKLTIIISAFGIGIGFGLQNIVNNLVSGLILAFEKPIQIGDFIEVNTRAGTMREIGIRSSKILTEDGSEVIIPNGDLISQQVTNWTLTNNNRRIELIVGVAYGSDILKIQKVLEKVLNENKEIMQTPEPRALLTNFNESSIDFKLLFWVPDNSLRGTIKSGLISDVYLAFAAEGIEIPYPKRDIQVHFPEGNLLNNNQNKADLDLSKTRVNENPGDRAQ
jgi:potassium efflux system protein